MREVLNDFPLYGGSKICVAEHYEIDFNWVFHLKTAQNLVAQYYEIDFDMISHLCFSVKPLFD